jgi:precorrin-6B C5,15-methyltransferase / cobalt-precorrin-6B C5,C15-methyltransferase
VSEVMPHESAPVRWLSIVGIGEDGVDGLSPAARRLIADAATVWGGARHLALAGDLVREGRVWPSPLSDAIPLLLAQRVMGHCGRSVCVLASGDPFHYGIGATLAAHIDPAEMLVLPAPSSFALAAARRGWPLQETACLSVHGRMLERVIPHLQPGARLLVLSWDATTPVRLAALIAGRGFGRSRLSVLEAMGGPRERVRTASARDFAIADADPLNLVAVEVVAEPGAFALPMAPGLPDDLFESDGQLTKREVRAVTLAALAPRQGDLLWDVGAGSGSVGIEWMLCHPSLRAVAIEERGERAARVVRNAAALGVPDLRLVEGGAPGALADLPPPDAVFVGGGAGDPGVLDAVWAALKPGGRLVVNAVSIETEAILADRFRRHGGTLTRLQVARADRVGGMHGWRAAMPVTQWAVTKGAE